MIFKSVAVLLAFVVGVTGVYLWLGGHPHRESFDEVDMAAIPSVGYCEMRNNPDKWSGRIIRIEADMYRFMHGAFLYDENCSGPADKLLIDNGRTSILSNTKLTINIFEHSLGRGDANRYIRVLMVGRFTYERPSGLADHISDRTAFHFEIYSVDSADLTHIEN